MDDLINVILEKIATAPDKNSMPVLTVERSDLYNICRVLKDNNKLKFDYLMCISGVDYKEYFEVVYQLHSISLDHKIAVKVKVDRLNPEVDSVTSIWKSANWHEREAFDLLGIRFNNHPDLRRILLPEEWGEVYPLRKDYEHKPDQYD